MGRRLVSKLKKGAAGSNSEPETKAKFLEHQRKLTLTMRAMREAQALHKRAIKAAKTAGLDPKQLQAALKAREVDPDVLKAEHNIFVRYCSWLNLPIGTQVELFGEGNTDGDDHLTDRERHEHMLFEADDAGYRAGRAGQDRSSTNPFPPGSETYVAFDLAYLRGQEVIAMEMGPNLTKIASARRSRRGGNPEDAPAAQEAAQ